MKELFLCSATVLKYKSFLSSQWWPWITVPCKINGRHWTTVRHAERFILPAHTVTTLDCDFIIGLHFKTKWRFLKLWQRMPESMGRNNKKWLFPLILSSKHYIFIRISNGLKPQLFSELHQSLNEWCKMMMSHYSLNEWCKS